MGLAGGFLMAGAGLVFLALLASKAGASVGGSSTSSGASSSGPSSPPPAGTSSMSSVRNYLQSQGLTKVAASGVVGNLWQESGGNPGAPGGGLAQWIGERWSALVAFAHAHGLDPSSEEAQLQYLVSDLHGPYSSLLAQLNGAGTPAQAAVLFQNIYERPSIPMQANRENYATQAYNAP